mgnify:FL=1
MKEWIDYYRKELQKPGVTKTLLWYEFRKENPQGYGHSQFCWYVLQLLKYLQKTDLVLLDDFGFIPFDQNLS